MLQNKKEHPSIKLKLHPRNKHRNRYNFDDLIGSFPELASFVAPNKFGDQSINFFDSNAVIALNKALLFHYYGITFWEIPDNYLCPPIPGRADYIHNIADLLEADNQGKIPKGNKIKCLDIGVGANCIYPIIGTKEYGWSFVGSDVDQMVIESARKIVEANKSLSKTVDIRLQTSSVKIFQGIIKENEFFDISICNPPFHASAKEAKAGTLRKLKNLKGKTIRRAEPNFGGQSNELWCDGGEKKFINKMILESRKFGNSCKWFSTLVSKESNLNSYYRTLENVNALKVKTINMGQGNKKSRIVAWTFQSKKLQ